MEAQRFDIDHSAKLIPAGSDIVFELHFTTNGTAGEDRTMVGLELARHRRSAASCRSQPRKPI